MLELRVWVQMRLYSRSGAICRCEAMGMTVLSMPLFFSGRLSYSRSISRVALVEACQVTLPRKFW